MPTPTPLLTRLKQSLSGFLIAVLLSPFLVHIEPAQSQENPSEYDLVAIFVDHNLYSIGQEDGSGLTGKIYRYAQDVQRALPNTKALILPVDPEESPKRMFDVLENLYLEGQQKDNSVFFLTGAVFIGNTKIPIVEGVVPFSSIFPLTDFEDPAFLWDANAEVFVPNSPSYTPNAEIWHGIIRGSASEISQYLDKNHAFHTSLRNGEQPYTDSVFSADWTQESSSLSDFAIQQYEQNQQYTEEIAYHRYTKNLLHQLQTEMGAILNPSTNVDDDGDGAVDEDPLDLQDNDGDGLVDEDDGFSLASIDRDDLTNFPDIHLKSQIDKLLPEYVVASQNISSEMLENVQNSGRWSESQIDTVPLLITAMDLMTREGLKELNTIFEQKVISLVQDEWQQDVVLSERVNGKSFREIESAEDCSLTFGAPFATPADQLSPSGFTNSQMVEYNRLYDPNSAGNPDDVCDPYGGCCINNVNNKNECTPSDADNAVFSWGGNSVVENVPNTAPNLPPSFRDCQIGADGNRTRKTVSSVVVHDAPRGKHIANALENISAGHIPSDGVRYVSFQGQRGQLEEIVFVNAFDIGRGDINLAPSEDLLVWKDFVNAVEQKENEINQKRSADGLVRTTELSDSIDDLASPFMQTLLRWNTLSVDEKHREVIRLFYNEQNTFLPRHRREGIALSYFRADGEDNTLLWNGVQKSSTDDQWNQLLRRSRGEKSEDKDDDDNSTSPADADQEKSYQCAPPGGVEIWEWYPAVQCWLESLQDLGENVKRVCGIDAGEQYLGQQPYRDPMTGDLVEPISQGTPVSLDITPRNETLAPQMETVFSGTVRDADGNKTAAGGILADVFVSGSGELVVEDQDPERVGVQILLVTGSFDIPIRATNSGIITVRVEAPDLEVGQSQVSVAPELSLSLSPVSDPIVQGSLFLYDVEATVQNSQDQIVDFDGEAYLTVSDPTRAFLGRTTITLSEGRAEFPIALRTGSVELSVTSPFVTKGSLVLGEELEILQPQKLVFHNVPEFVDLNSEVRFPLRSMSVDGSIGQVSPEIWANIDVQFTDHTQGLANISLEGNEVVITTANRAGVIRIFAEGEGLDPAVAELQIGAMMDGDEFAALSPNSVITQVLGVPTADPLDGDNMAQKMLFSGKTQFYTGLTHRGSVQAPRAKISRDGVVQIFDDALLPVVSSLSPLRIKMFDPLAMNDVAEFEIQKGEDREDEEGDRGVLFQNFDTSGLITVETGAEDDSTNILLEDRLIASVDEHMNFEILDQRFSLSLDDQSQEQALVLSLLLDFETIVGQFVIDNARLSLIDAEYISSSEVISTADGGWYVPGAEFVVSHLFPGATDDISRDVEGALWKGESISNLLIASGQHVGEAMKSAANPILINWGDPTISLARPNAGSTGFDTAVGSEILFSDNADLVEIVSGDMDGDTLSDIAVLNAENEIAFLQNTGNGQFRNWGKFSSSARQIVQMAMVKNSSGFADILVLDAEGNVSVLTNDREVFVLQELNLFSAPVFKMASEDLDDDGFGDLVVHQADGVIEVVYGTERILANSQRENTASSEDAPESQVPFSRARDTISSLGSVADSAAIEFVFEHLDTAEYPDDNVLDITLLSNESKSEVVTFVSSNQRLYTKVARNRGAPESPESLPNTTDTNDNGIPDEYETDDDADGVPDVAQNAQRAFQGDADGDEIPDYWDSAFTWEGTTLEAFGNDTAPGRDLQAIDSLLGEAVSQVQNSTCQNGGCMAIPFNYAFLVPGRTNATSQLANTVSGSVGSVVSDFQSVVNTFGGAQMSEQLGAFQENFANLLGPLREGEGILGIPETFGFPVFGTLSTIPYVCAGAACNTPASNFRFYISPTLTGGTGIAICKGPYPGGKCFATGIPLAAMTGVCDQINESIENFFSEASHATSSLGGSQVAFVVDPNTNGPRSRGSIGGEVRLGTIAFDTSPGNNVVPESSPGWFSRWVSAQQNEILEVFIMPSFTVYYPDVVGAWGHMKEEVENFRSRRSEDGGEDPDEENPESGDETEESEDEESGESETSPPERLAERLSNLSQNTRQGIDTVYDRLGFDQLAESGRRVDETVDSIQDVYTLLRSIPLLDIRERTILIAVPHISRQRLFAILDDLEKWKKDAERELSEWQDFVEAWQCPSEASPEECDQAREAMENLKQKVNIDVTSQFQTLERNIEILNEYLAFSNVVAHYEEELAKYINGIICYVDAVADLTGGWFQENLKRVEDWMVFYMTFQEIKKQWKSLFKALYKPIENCPACTADNYMTTGGVFDIVAGVIPTPPVLEFLKIPDIVIDVSQIKTGLSIEVPVLEFSPQEVEFPQLPRLRLPRVPTATVVLPQIPLLPELPPLPTLPPFPDVAIPELPTIPPPPKLPTISADLTKVASVAEKILVLWCLYKQGLFVYDEMELKPIIEQLTNRPSSVLLDIDLLNLSFPEFSVPSVEELRITSQVNMTLEFDTLVETIAEEANRWNQMVFDEKQELQRSINEDFDFGELLDAESGNPIPENILLDPFESGQPGPVRERRPSDTVEPLNSRESRHPLSSELSKSFLALQTLADESEDVYFQYIADALAIPEATLPGFAGSDTQEYLSSLRAALSEREHIRLQRAQQLVASNDISVLFDTPDRAQIEIPSPPTRTASVQYMGDKNVRSMFQFPSSKLHESRSTFHSSRFTDSVFQVSSSNLGEPRSTLQDSRSTNSTPQLRRQGIFLYDQELGQAQKIVSYPGFDNVVRQMSFADVDGDGDDDLLLLTPNRLMLKTNSSLESFPSFLSSEPEVGDFESFLPSFAAVKNIQLDQNPDSVGISFEAYDSDRIAGVEIVAKNALTGYIRTTETQTKTVQLVLPEYLDALGQLKIGNEDFSPNASDTPASDQPSTNFSVEELVTDFYELELEEGFWTVKMRWILTDGSRGTFSQSHLASIATQNDMSAPIFVGEQVRRVPIFEEATITAEGVVDLESAMSFEWDFGADGSVDAVGYATQVGPFDEPLRQNIILRATDSGKNTLEIPILLEVFVPEITLETFVETKDLLSLQDSSSLREIQAQGQTTPSSAQMPFALLRQRWNTWKMIRTPTADENGRYFTDPQGAYEILDFDHSPDAVVKDHAGVVIARILGTNGRVFLEQEGYALQAYPGDGTYLTRIAVVSDDGSVVANIVFEADGTSDVRELNTPIDASASLYGVNLFDRNPDDTIAFAGLPVDAPSFAGGGVIFDSATNEVIAMISRQGDVRFLAGETSLSLKGSQNPETDPVVFQILFGGRVVFDLFVEVDFSDITLHQGEYWEGKTVAMGKNDFDVPAGKYAAEGEERKESLEFREESLELGEERGEGLELESLEFREESLELGKENLELREGNLELRDEILELGEENLELREGNLELGVQGEKEVDGELFSSSEYLAQRYLDEGSSESFQFQVSEAESVRRDTGERSLPFSDIDEDHPYYSAIASLYERNILEGFSDGTFRPDDQINRTEFVKIVLGATSCLDCTRPTPFELERFFEPYPFPDVSFGQWFAFCVSKAKKLGIIQGYGDGTFRAGQNISRAEAVAILLRAANIPLVQESETAVLSSASQAQDLRDVPEYAWYRGAIVTAIDLGLIPVRDGGFVLPEQQITRGEFAFMATKLLEISDCRDQDTDGDQMPDSFEIANGFDETDPSDAEQDADGDGVLNGDEFFAGTNPRESDGNDGGEDSADSFADDGADDGGVADGDGGGDSADSFPDDEGDDGEDTGQNSSGEDPDNAQDDEEDSADGGENDAQDEGDVAQDDDDPSGAQTDLCPFAPEDMDGIDDDDGCPEVESDADQSGGGVHVYPGDPAICGFLDYVADIRPGDVIKAAILPLDNSEIFSESEETLVDFVN